MTKSEREDYSPLGIFIAGCLALLFCAQFTGLKIIILDSGNPKYHDSTMWVGLTSMYSIILWFPGLILGYKIFKKLGNKLVGGITLGVSLIQSLIFIWALCN